MPRHLLLLLACLLPLSAGEVEATWPQFRGPGGLGLGTGKPPVEFGPDKNVRWKVAVPRGHSSPCIWGERLVITGLDDGKLVTICLNRADGAERWRGVAPTDKIEAAHRIGSPAASTPCSDGERFYVYFGSYGLIAYDLDGKEVWTKPLPTPVVEFGTGSSPIVADGRLFLVNDQDVGSHLLALDAKTGAEVWRRERPEFRRSFSTPFLWRHDGIAELVVAGSLSVRSYEPADGKDRWSARGLARVSNASPTAGDGQLIISSWNVGGDEGARVSVPPADEFLAANDRDHDGVLTRAEFPAGPLKDRYSQIDVDKDAKVTRAEVEIARTMFAEAENRLFALRPAVGESGNGGTSGAGDISASHVAWATNKHLPYVSSPLCYQGRVYAMQNGGLLSCYDAATGTVHWLAERVGAPGDYYSSAVAAAGRVYIASQQGVVVVLAAGTTLQVLARNKLDGQVFATPAIIDGIIYLRTESGMWAFGM